MKKIFIALSILAVSATGISAQTATSKQDKANATQYCNPNNRHQCTAANPFAGINLSQQQIQKLDELKASRKASKAANDSICRAKRAEKIASAKNMRAEYLKNVKAILTPEQYVQFLENSYVNAPRHHKKDKFGKDGRRHKNHGNKNFGAKRSNINK